MTFWRRIGIAQYLGCHGIGLLAIFIDILKAAFWVTQKLIPQLISLIQKDFQAQNMEYYPVFEASYVTFS